MFQLVQNCKSLQGKIEYWNNIKFGNIIEYTFNKIYTQSKTLNPVLAQDKVKSYRVPPSGYGLEKEKFWASE